MTPIEQAIETLARCTPYIYKAAPVEMYAAYCSALAALRAQPAPPCNITVLTNEHPQGIPYEQWAQPDHSDLVKDATRYRWMKSEVKRIPPGWEMIGWDAAIDLAMSADALEGKQ